MIDNYQAGEIRSTRNLSGGESFIVSLTLALGLSRMASRKVRVDSLFLDEGFGTLDEDALETGPGNALRTSAGGEADRNYFPCFCVERKNQLSGFGQPDFGGTKFPFRSGGAEGFVLKPALLCEDFFQNF